jgi:hypothetical protein
VVELQRVFRELSEPGQYKSSDRLLPAEKLREALSMFGVPISEVEADEFIESSASERSKLSFKEFKQAVDKQWQAEAWARSLPLATVLADALPYCQDCSRFLAIGSMTKDEIDAIVDGYRDGLRRMLQEQVGELRKSLDSMKEMGKSARSGNQKFEVAAMRTGTVADFHAGLKKRIGKAQNGSVFGERQPHSIL